MLLLSSIVSKNTNSDDHREFWNIGYGEFCWNSLERRQTIVHFQNQFKCSVFTFGRTFSCWCFPYFAFRLQLKFFRTSLLTVHDVTVAQELMPCVSSSFAVGRKVSSLFSSTPLSCRKNFIAAFAWCFLLNNFNKDTIHYEFCFSVPVWCGHLLYVKASRIHSLYFRCCLWLIFSGNFVLSLVVVVCLFCIE